MILGIMGAMQEEVQSIVSLLKDVKKTTIADREFYEGNSNDVKVVIVFSRWGKVAASMTATILINVFKTDALIFTGDAGAIDPQLNIGDIVVGHKCIQHDMDARPFFPQHQIPLTVNSYFSTCEQLTQKLKNSIKDFLRHDFPALCPDIKQNFKLFSPKVLFGTIASGDQFIHCPIKLARLKTEIDSALAVEMEGAAVAQVCLEFAVPFSIIRTISDKADHDAAIDFQQFIATVAPFYALGVMKHFLTAY